MKLKAMNFGCGEVIIKSTDKVEWHNSDLPSIAEKKRDQGINVEGIDLDEKLPFPDGYFDYGLCRCTIPYVKDVAFTCKELLRVCKTCDISFPPRGLASPSQFRYGRPHYTSFGVRELLHLNPSKVTIQFFNYIFLKKYTFDPKKNWSLRIACYWEIYFSMLIMARNLWVSFGDTKQFNRGES